MQALHQHRRCERSEAIPTFSAEKVGIASSQELLATTGDKAALQEISRSYPVRDNTLADCNPQSDWP
jgi:hypothetical protein